MTMRVVSPVDGIGGEHHARALGGDHLLDDDGDRRLVRRCLARRPVGDDPRAVERRPAVDHARQQVVVARDVGEGRVHAGERGVAGVLAGARGAHRDDARGRPGGGRPRGSAVARSSGRTIVRTSSWASSAAAVRSRWLSASRRRRPWPSLSAMPAAATRVAVGVGGHDEARRAPAAGRGQLAEVGALAAHEAVSLRRICVEPADASPWRPPSAGFQPSPGFPSPP